MLERLGLAEEDRQAVLDYWSEPSDSALSLASVLARQSETLDLMVTGPETGVLEAIQPTPLAELPDLGFDDGDRYTMLGMLGKGAMGVVYRVFDRDLGRVVAMKVIRADKVRVPGVLPRFIREAQAVARLEHPGIAPVYDIGRVVDGRIYFTTREIRGRDLRQVIKELHAAATGGRWQRTENGWTLRRVVAVLHSACEAVASAHAQLTIHRDLKPQNIMVGEFGEVLVVDWGLVKVLGRIQEDGTEGLETRVSSEGADDTVVGTITGTPAYMPPEQAMGLVDALGPSSDVYTLGAALYQILSGRPPYKGRDAISILRQVRKGPPASCVRTGHDVPPVPEELEQICLKAMARYPDDRYEDAAALASELDGWLQGAMLRAKAIGIVAEADVVLEEHLKQRVKARELRASADRLISWVGPHEYNLDKEESWEMEDRALALEQASQLKLVEFRRLLHLALNHVPDLPEAHERLATHYWQEHQHAEASGDKLATARFEATLRIHDRGRYSVYLEGMGSLSLVTDPPNAHVELYRYEEEHRRLVPKHLHPLGKAPIENLPLAMGSYLLKIRAPGRVELSYPVQIRRQGHWDGIRVEGQQARAIFLPPQNALSPGDCYVPVGPFWSGGDGLASESGPRERQWAEAFVMKRFPVTNAQYIKFLDDLVAAGRESTAMRHVPRERAGTTGERGAIIYGRTPRGGFCLRADADGDIWQLQWPVIMIDWFGALAYAQWFAHKTGLPWRLPRSIEWEKAARGADGRTWPCGNFLDTAWSCTRGSHRSRPLPVEVDTFPLDVSPYGVRGMAGNVRDWCSDVFSERSSGGDDTGLRRANTELDARAEPRRVLRGGEWSGSRRAARAATRASSRADYRDPKSGFRLVRSIIVPS